MPSSIDDPSAGLLGDEEAPGDCHSAVRGIGVVTLAFGGLVITNVCVLLFKELSQIDGEYLYNPIHNIFNKCHYHGAKRNRYRSIK